MKRSAKAIARKNTKLAAAHLFATDKGKKDIIQIIANTINHECRKLSQSNPEIRKENPLFSNIYKELREKCPTLSAMIEAACKRRKPSNCHELRVAAAFAILMNERNRNNCSFQNKISVLLFLADAKKQVQPFSLTQPIKPHLNLVKQAIS